MLRLLAVNAATLGRDHSGLARFVADSGADVAVVHASPHLLRWRSICAALARKAGLVVVGGGRTGGANLILSSLGVDVRATVDIRFEGGSLLAPAGATAAALRWRGTEFVVAGARMTGTDTDRLAQARDLDSTLTGLVPGEPPSVVSADGAAGADRPGSLTWQALLEKRVAVGDVALFVDERVTIEQTERLSGAAVVTLSL